MAGLAALMAGVEDTPEAQSQRLLQGVEATWEEVEVGADGALALNAFLARERGEARRRVAAAQQGVKRGMMRCVVLVLDLSLSMEAEDLRPTRWDCVLAAARTFVLAFFDQNPISHLALAVMRQGRAELVSDLSGSMAKHLKKLDAMSEERSKFHPAGDASLQNTLKLCTKVLTAMPLHSTREVLIVFGGLSSCDPGDVFETIKQAETKRLRVSIIGLAAAVKLCQTICHDTQGSYGIVLDEHHLSELMHQHTVPPVSDVENKSALVRMGFPTYAYFPVLETRPTAAESATNAAKEFGMRRRGRYSCPRCGALEAELPAECQSCGLFLVLSPHLARTFHHLFPLDTFTETITTTTDKPCAGCTRHLAETAYECPNCSQLFCYDCDIFLHDTLHNCPGCSHA